MDIKVTNIDAFSENLGRYLSSVNNDFTFSEITQHVIAFFDTFSTDVDMSNIDIRMRVFMAVGYGYKKGLE